MPAIRLQVEPLQARLLPSTVLPRPLSGRAHGSYVSSGILVDVGPFYDVKGTATLRTIGHASLQGALAATSIDGAHRAGGDVIFSNARGSVTIDLQGPLQQGFKPLPSAFQYHVVSGSGAYRHVRDRGSADLHLVPAPQQGGTAFGLHERGTFTLMLRSQD